MISAHVTGRENVTNLLWGDALDDAVNYPLDHVLLVDSPTSSVNIQLVILHR